MKAKILYKHDKPIGLKINVENEEEATVLNIMDIHIDDCFRVVEFTRSYSSLGVGELYLMKEGRKDETKSADSR